MSIHANLPISHITIITIITILLIIPLLAITAFGYGSTGTIAAAFGDNGFFCAIDASGKQEIICWDRDNKSSSQSSQEIISSSLPAMASLSGGEGFLCGVSSNNSRAFCWNLLNPGQDLVPEAFKYNSYLQVAAGKNHVCGIRGSYDSTVDFGSVDCWEYQQTVGGGNFTSGILWNSSFKNAYVDSLMFKTIVSGDGFSCGVVKEGEFLCWGPRSTNLGISSKTYGFDILASGRNSVCGISSISGEVKCWGDGSDFRNKPNGPRFVGLSAGASHFCGIHEDDHGIECWGNITGSSVPKGSGFVALASSDYTTCGVREFDLVLDCWGVHGQSTKDYSPPLQLWSPGMCSLNSCGSGWFAFNASNLNEPELTSLCLRKDLNICLPCGTNCSDGYFPSSQCNQNADRVCSLCSLCQNASCFSICKLPTISVAKQQIKQEKLEIKKFSIIIGCSVLGFLMFISGLFLIPRIIKPKDEDRTRISCCLCVGKRVVEADPDSSPRPAPFTAESIGETQIFRLTELKDATHGFKEFNELGRGSFGFVYKAVLPNGSQVAVKRANAATIIHTNSREFEAEVEVLVQTRHSNIVNLLGYCAEMGERLLVYEYMPHGTLHDHLHNELSPLDWNMRLKIALQAARGLEYLHNEFVPPIVHRDVKTSNILLDAEWGARIADFGLLSTNDRDLNADMESDVYNFGIVLLEILSGRKAEDRDFDPPGIVEWAVPLIRKGKAAATIDRNVGLPRNVEPLLKLADLAELALRENPIERPSIRNLASFLDLIVKNGLMF